MTPAALVLLASLYCATAMPTIDDNAEADAMTSKYELIEVVQVGNTNLSMYEAPPPFTFKYSPINAIRYGVPEGTPEVMPRELDKRCGENVVFCTPNRGNLARADICMDIINSFRDPKFSNNVIKNNLRVTCNSLGATKGKCCVGLTQNTKGTGATYGDLFPAALKVYNQCRSGNFVSGYTLSTTIGGVCGKQCLSASEVC